MADIEMPDASSSASAKPRTSGITKASKTGAAADTGSDGKKRFEVKKVATAALQYWFQKLIMYSGMLWLSGHGILL